MLSIFTHFKQKKKIGEPVPLFETTFLDRIKSFFYDIVKPNENPYRILTENGYPLAQERKMVKESKKNDTVVRGWKVKSVYGYSRNA